MQSTDQIIRVLFVGLMLTCLSPIAATLWTPTAAVLSASTIATASQAVALTALIGFRRSQGLSATDKESADSSTVADELPEG